MQKKYTIKLEQLRSDLDNYKKSSFVHSDKLMYDGINVNDRDRLITEIKNYIKDNDVINTETIINKLFPTKTPHLFISHKSEDAKEAITLANILHSKFGIESFIDSQVWHHINDIQKILDDEFSKKRENLYDYKKCNIVSSNIFSMLSSSLYRTIDDSDGFIYIDRNDAHEDIGISKSNMVNIKTESPWIYLENIYTNSLRIKQHNRKKIMLEKAGLNNYAADSQVSTESRKEPKFIYSTDLVNAVEIKSLNNAFNVQYDKTKKHPLEGLDYFYSIILV
ncbi:hypothetical protein RFL90_005110 [Klebsiella pneumoniae]|jgi:hypothetical protein|uniref:TIR domain-containing protein n=2 Tax=Enterobacteriaceae TaxID=543 RepID=A0A9Q8FJ07_KLEPN|nr:MULTISPECIES: hypothetical protein [Klebsiella]RDA96413.1 hypothetical protein DVB85_30820 [Klebsiella oxytoca]HAY5651117.1 hypothetical protein [Escherichia coli]HBY0172854.1 hypothetical protein [Klebsiella pneumoniae subsp. pneumoniae]HDT3403452.1 hypothetical protein [Klebsiella pneumoniae subsp. ozaenae]EKV8644247.1 hypothetical protein [Klebsiella pneumoniae]